MEAHKQETCKKRKANCIYCELSLDFDKIQEHIDFCGSRTEKCAKCNQYIQFKDKYKHDSSNCAYPPPQQPKPQQAQASTQPRLPRYQSLQPPYFYNLNQQAANNSQPRQPRQTRDENDDNVSFSLLPCEFCSDYFPSSELIEHQNSCEMNPIFTEEAIVPDPIESQLNGFRSLNLNNPFESMNLLSTDPLRMHRELLQNAFGGTNLFGNTRNPVQNNLGEDYFYMNNQDYDEEDDEEASAEPKRDETDKIPCELCDELVDFEDYQVHQLTCKYSEEALAASRPAIDPILQQYDKNNNENVIKKPDQTPNIKSETNEPVHRLNPYDNKKIQIPTSSKSILKNTSPSSDASVSTLVKPALKPTISSNGIKPISVIKKTNEISKPRQAGFAVPTESKSILPTTSSASSSSSSRPSTNSKPTPGSKPNGLSKPK